MISLHCKKRESTTDAPVTSIESPFSFDLVLLWDGSEKELKTQQGGGTYSTNNRNVTAFQCTRAVTTPLVWRNSAKSKAEAHNSMLATPSRILTRRGSHEKASAHIAAEQQFRVVVNLVRRG